jgi:hypothetical protein
MDKFIQVYEKAFNDEFCNRVIECYNINFAEKGWYDIMNRQDHMMVYYLNVPKVRKEDTATYFTKTNDLIIFDGSLNHSNVSYR